jgi:hypothetical protein
MKRNLILLLLLLSFSGFSQTYYNDAQAWFNFYVEKKITKKFLVHLNQQDRFENNISQYRLGYADVGITYRFTKQIKILVDYVFTGKKRNTDYFRTVHQYYVALVLKKDIRRWRFSYRNMLQMQYNDPMTSKNGYFPYSYDRNKFTVRYEVSKRFLFYTAEELYSPLNNQQLKNVDRSRTFIGMFYNINKTNQLEFYFLFQSQLNKGDWYKQKGYYPDYMMDHYFVYGIGYSIAF